MVPVLGLTGQTDQSDPVLITMPFSESIVIRTGPGRPVRPVGPSSLSWTNFFHASVISLVFSISVLLTAPFLPLIVALTLAGRVSSSWITLVMLITRRSVRVLEKSSLITTRSTVMCCTVLCICRHGVGWHDPTKRPQPLGDLKLITAAVVLEGEGHQRDPIVLRHDVLKYPVFSRPSFSTIAFSRQFSITLR
ncbi:hypothetical protein CRG98_046029 [Punica granatum]|uniref:Uncharacterized protein n=1 Tax=Punica granatum TaxID=22663 RepID=A0A2I0HPS3_PUNGR|nr:hypothetical protein CRG98_046029 [Punica granatum]